jgi:hypothetical protein
VNRNLTVSAAVLAILSAHAASAADAPDRTDAQPPLLQEVIVTAQHREGSIQYLR